MKTIMLVLVAAALAGLVGWRLAQRQAAPAALADPFAQMHHARPTDQASSGAARPTEDPAARLAQDDAGKTLVSEIDLLTSAKTSFAEKMATWDKIRKGGRIEEAVATLKQLANENPGDASLAIALGEAEINQLRAVAENGGTFNEEALIAIEADREFDAALTIDSTSWEAQFEKASALRGWPAGLGKGPEVIDRLNALVAQQSSMPSQPEFARTYAILGEQYQAAGQADRAMQTWQQGLSQFPLDASLQQDLARGQAR